MHFLRLENSKLNYFCHLILRICINLLLVNSVVVKKFQLFLEQLECVIQGRETSIRCLLFPSP